MTQASPGSAAADDDPTVPAADAVYRRLPHRGPDFVFVDALTGTTRPTSGSFMPDADGLSIYRRDILDQNALTAVDVTIDPTTNGVCSVDVGDVRSLGLGLRNNPWPADSDGHPRDIAHALVKGLNELGRKPQLRCRQALAKLPSTRMVYPPT